MAITLDGTNGITTPDLNATGGVNTDTISDEAGTGAPNFPNGVTANGVNTDTISNEAGTGAPNFPNGVTVNSNPIATAGSLSNRNKIINGNFDIWQRGTSGTLGYLADRWATGLIGSTAAISRQSFALGQTDVPNEPAYFSRNVITSVAGSSNFARYYQRVENVRTFAGQTVTLSFWAKADASKDIAVEFAQSFGTGGSPSTGVTEIGVTTCSLTTSWQKFTVTASIPSISGKTLGTNNNDYLMVIFWLDAGSNLNSRTNSLGQQSGTFDIAQVQLEAGDVATPFEVRTIGQELALCQRYYIKIPEQSSQKRAYNWSGVFLALNVSADFPTTMRASPSLVVYGDVSDGTVITLGGAGVASLASGFTVFTNISSGQFLDMHYYTADAEL